MVGSSSPESLEGLCNILRGPDAPSDVIELAALLMHFMLAREARLLGSNASTEPQRIRLRSMQACKSFCDTIDSALLDQDECSQLADAIEGCVSEERVPPEWEAFVVRGAADAVGEGLGRFFLDPFVAGETVTIREGDVVPTAQPPLAELYVRRQGSTTEKFLGANPHRRGHDSISIRNLSLLRFNPGGVRVELDFTKRSVLAGLTAESKVASIVPCDYADLQRTVIESGRFFPVCAQDCRTVLERIQDRLQRALDDGHRVVVLPEVCLDAETFDELVHWVRARAVGFDVVVCGSCHIEERATGRRLNRAAIVFGDGTVDYHEKLNPYDELIDGVPHVEDIDTSAQALRVFHGSHWSFATVICKDLLGRLVPELLRPLRVSLLAVPACSGDTSGFEAIAQELAVQEQTHMLLANVCDHVSESGHRPAVAFLSRPVRNTYSIVEVHRRAEMPTPALVSFELFRPPRAIA